VVTDIVLPQSGLEVSEGTIVAVDVAVGDRVEEGDRLLEVETDKAMTEIVAPRAGVILSIEVEVEDTVEVGATLIRLRDSEPAAAQTAPHPEPTVAQTAPAEPSEPATVPVEAAAPSGAAALSHAGEVHAASSPDDRRGAHRIRAAPIARRAAAELGVALEEVAGTGPRGRITLGDVERMAHERGASPGAGNGVVAATTDPDAGERLEPMSATRRTVARRMTESQLIPQFSLHRDVDAAWLLGEKERLGAAGAAKIGVNDLLAQALAETVARHPDLGSSFVAPRDGGQPQLLRHDGVNVGLAVATERGLVVPVIRRAHERTLAELALERGRLVAAARDGRLERSDLTGATVTLSSLAGMGVDRFTAMLNPGESAILAVGRTVDRVVPRDRGLAVVPMMTLTFTLDHRVVDGGTGAGALAELAELLEGGMTWRA
jgi:pyruvate dehydrogenase E2 component (dihydrolipoamide acetyltransferase)